MVTKSTMKVYSLGFYGLALVSIVLSNHVAGISLIALIALTILLIVLTVVLARILRNTPTSQPGLIPKIIPMMGWTLNPKSPNFVPSAFYLGDIFAFMASSAALDP